MPSSERLARPEEWPARYGAKYMLSLVFVTIIGIACVPIGLGFAAIGRPAAVRYAMLLAALLLLAVAFGLVTRVLPKQRLDDVALTVYGDSPATEIRYSQAAFAITAALMACLTTICAMGAFDFAFATQDVPAAPIASILLGLGALFSVSFFAFAALGRVKRGRIVLSRRGIHQHGRAFSSFLEWESLVGVKATHNGVPEVLVIADAQARWERHQHGGVWKLDKPPPVPMIEVDTTMLAVDPTLVYHLLRFYVENPAARTELGTETSLRRVRTEDFR